MSRPRRTTREYHGEGEPRSTEYLAWAHMIERCYNPNCCAWKYYGARGVRVCDRWRNSYVAFLADMGRKPSAKHSIDRKNNDGNYEPKNCRWSTRLEQARNQRRPNRKLNPEAVKVARFFARKYPRRIGQIFLSRLFGVSQAALNDAILGKSWSWV